MKLLNEFLKINKRTILYRLYDENYSLLWENLNHDFYIFDYHNKKQWDHKKFKLPKNHRIIKILTPDIQPDTIICQDKSPLELNVLKPLSEKYGAKLIFLERNNPKEGQEKLVEFCKNYNSVFFNNYQTKTWNADHKKSTVIHPPIPTTNSIGGQLIINKENSHEAHYNVLKNMGMGNCVVTIGCGDLPLIIKIGINGYMYNEGDEKTLNNYITKLKNNTDLMFEVGKNAQNTIKRILTLEKFEKAWENCII